MEEQIKLIEAIPLLISYFIVSALIVYMCHKSPIINKLGAIALAYGIGIIVGNIGIIPEGIDFLQPHAVDGTVQKMNTVSNFQEDISSFLVALGIPLLLFSLNVKKWLKYAKSTFAALFLGLISIIIMIFTGYFLFKGGIEEIDKVGGLLTGIYTGGSPNMAALKISTEVEQTTYIAATTYEMFLCAPLFLILISYGQKIIGWVLPPFKKSVSNENNKDVVKEMVHKQSKMDSYQGFFNKSTFPKLLLALLLAFIIFGGSYLLRNIFPENNIIPKDAIFILLVTTFGILASFSPKVAGIVNTFQLGMFLIIVFSLVVASMADVSKLIKITSNLFFYVGLTVYGSLIIHLILSKIFKVDTDTFIIITTALVFSPPFVPAVAGALKNREIIMTGMIAGLIGYAIGNYLGFGIYMLLGSF